MNETFAFFYALETGVVKRWKSEKVECGACDGRGRKRCETCHGVGFIVGQCGECLGSKLTVCSSCSAKHETCSLCAGKGKVRLPARPMIHPADTWTLPTVRSLSINGSFT